MKKQWKTFFYFTRTERNGIVTLALFCLVLLVIPALFRYWQPANAVDFTAFEQLIADTATARRAPAAPRALFYFNPNTLPTDSFRLLGLDERTAGSIARYRDKGGRFFAPRDFAKIYTLSAEDYNRIEPYIRIPGAGQKAHRTPEAPAKLTWFDPNTVTYEDLITLGLPAKTAHIWVNFRKKGGAFRRPEDLRKDLRTIPYKVRTTGALGSYSRNAGRTFCATCAGKICLHKKSVYSPGHQPRHRCRLGATRRHRSGLCPEDHRLPRQTRRLYQHRPGSRDPWTARQRVPTHPSPTRLVAHFSNDRHQYRR